MRLKKLELINVCRHENLEMEFEPGLIGILGPNGSGKSSAINIAAYAALTNDYSRHLKGKSGMIRQQAGPKDESRIRLEFSHLDEEYAIHRGLQGCAAHKMYTGGASETIQKAGEIQQMLEGVLGIKRRLIDEFIFVEQWKLFSFFAAQPADRMRSFAHLCNTVLSEQLWSELGDVITKDEAAIAAFRSIDGSSDETREKLGHDRNRLKTLNAEINDARQHLVSKKREQELATICRKYSKYADMLEELPDLEKQEKDHRDKCDKLQSRLTERQSNSAVADHAAESFKEDHDKAVTKLATIKEREKQLVHKTALVQRLDQVKTQISELIIPVKPEFVFSQEEWDEVSASYLHCKKLLDTFDDTGLTECPICGTETDSLESEIESAREHLPKFEQAQERLRAAKISQEGYEYGRHSYEQDLALLNGRATAMDEELAKLKDVKRFKKSYVEKMAEDVKKYRLALQDQQQATQALNAQQQLLAVAVALYKTAKDRVEEHRSKLADTVVSEEENIAASNELADHKKAQQTIKTKKSVVAEVQAAVDSSKKRLEQLATRMSKANKMKKWIRDITDVRDEVLHSEKLPKEVHHSYLVDMQDDINSELEQFYSPFTVEATEDVSFTAHFVDGTEMPAQPGGLSGGQLVMLAIATRLTLNSLFAPQLGIMILDEPTDGLDAENRRLAASVFKRLGELAKSRGHQVIVITHDELLESCFDQKFVLEKP